MARPKRTGIRSLLVQHQKQSELITIRREPLDPFSLGAFVVDIGTDLVLVNDVTDLSRDGYKVLRIRDISRIERGGSEKELSDRVIPYARITAVTFDDRYSMLYSKYVREPK